MNRSLSWMVGDIRGAGLWLVTAVSLGWGWLILSVLPYWQRLETAEGTVEVQARFHDAAELARVLARWADAGVIGDARLFLWLDMPNAVLFGLSLAALIRFGLRLAALPWPNLALLAFVPLIGGVADLAENATLLILTAMPAPLVSLSSALTAVKLATGQAAIAIMLVVVLVGAGLHLSNRLHQRRQRA